MKKSYMEPKAQIFEMRVCKLYNTSPSDKEMRIKDTEEDGYFNSGHFN